MNILCIGDVVGRPGLDFLCSRAPLLRRSLQADLIVANGENADASGVGISRTEAETLLQYVDVVTTGNHSHRRSSGAMYAEIPTLLHPANIPFTENGAGCCLVDTGRLGSVRVVNLVGTAWLEPVDNPFKRADELLAWGDAKYTVIDFHAESSAEKKALAFYLDGRVSAFYGTHTHVQTADEQILPGGAGYMTDVGMTGPVLSVLGIRPQDAVKKQREHLPAKFQVAGGPVMLNAVLFTLSDADGLCTGVRRLDIREESVL